MTTAGFPATTTFAGTLFVTTAPAATTEFFSDRHALQNRGIHSDPQRYP
jgi:hypothetical protein